MQVMRAGVALGKATGQDIQPTLLEKEVRAPNGSNWRKKHFRVYRVKWTPGSTTQPLCLGQQAVIQFNFCSSV